MYGDMKFPNISAVEKAVKFRKEFPFISPT
jgi:hypothetical protein